MCTSGNLYIAVRDNEILGTTYFESQLALDHKAYATTKAGIGKVTIFLPQTLDSGADIRNIIGTKYVVMNIIKFPKTRTGGAESEYVFCNETDVLFFITSKEILNHVYIPKASIGCTDLKIAIFIGPEMHLFSEVPLRVRFVGRIGCRQVWNESFDTREILRPITRAFSYQADMTDEEIQKEGEDLAEQMRVHAECEQLFRDKRIP